MVDEEKMESQHEIEIYVSNRIDPSPHWWTSYVTPKNQQSTRIGIDSSEVSNTYLGWYGTVDKSTQVMVGTVVCYLLCWQKWRK